VLRFDLRSQRLHGGRVRRQSDDVSVGQQKELGAGWRDQLAYRVFSGRHDEAEALRQSPVESQMDKRGVKGRLKLQFLFLTILFLLLLKCV